MKSSCRSCGTPLSGEPPTDIEKEEDFREEGTLSGHGGIGRYADPRADRYGAGDGSRGQTRNDGGEGPPQERWCGSCTVGPACCRPADRWGHPRVRCLASQVGSGERRIV